MGAPIKIKLVWFPLKIKQCGNLVNFILCCYLVKMNYLGRQENINKCGHQEKLVSWESVGQAASEHSLLMMVSGGLDAKKSRWSGGGWGTNNAQ